MAIKNDRLTTEAIFFPDHYRDNMEPAVYKIDEAKEAMLELRQYQAILQGQTGYFKIVKIGNHIYKYTEDVKIFARKLGSIKSSVVKSSGVELISNTPLLKQLGDIFISQGYNIPSKSKGMSTSRKTGGITFTYWKEKQSKIPGCKWMLYGSLVDFKPEQKELSGGVTISVAFETPEKIYVDDDISSASINGTGIFVRNFTDNWSGWRGDRMVKEFAENFSARTPDLVTTLSNAVKKANDTLSGLEDLFLIDTTKKFNITEEGLLISYFNSEKEETITIPEGVKTIASSVFKSVPLKKVFLPKTLEVIQKEAFERNSTLQQVVFHPETTRLTIERDAFENCENLSEITFPSCPTVIGPSAFSYCKSLFTVFIPKTVTSVGERSFSFAGWGNDGRYKIYVEHPSKPYGWSEEWYISNLRDRGNYEIIWDAKSLPEPLQVEESISSTGKPSRDDLKKAAKRHKKTDKKGARGWFLNRNAGLVKVAIDKFNNRTPSESSPMPSIGNQYTAPADGGSSSSSMGVGSAPAGLGEAVLTEKVEKHEVLNPKLWEGNNLKSEVKDKILEIVKTFVEGLEKDNIKINVKDIILIGSNASYNYSNTSDLDVHIIVDTEGLECPDELYPLLYSSYRSIFNKKYDIEFYGTGVELFIDTEDTKTISNGIYSLNKGWIKEPVKEDIPELDEERFNLELTKWEDKYFDLIKGEELNQGEKQIQDITESLESYKIEEIDDFVEDIYDLRKVSLQTEGEYSIGNLVFKEMRSLGYLDNLKAIKNNIKSRELSLEGLDKNVITESFSSKPMTTLEQVDEYAGLAKEGNATYDLDENGKPKKVELSSGFQVSFFRPEIREQGNEALNLVLDAIGSSFGQQYLGFFGGVPEISYTLEISLAKEVARIFNQESVWDNENQSGIDNELHDGLAKVNYEEAVVELKELLGK